MRKILDVFQTLFAAPPRPEPGKDKHLSRQEVLLLMANHKLSARQAKAVMAKRRHD